MCVDGNNGSVVRKDAINATPQVNEQLCIGATSPTYAAIGVDQQPTAPPWRTQACHRVRQNWCIPLHFVPVPRV